MSTIAGMYKDNAFHNFEHASHVTASASKFLHRFIHPECEDVEVAKELHEITDGINSDPLTQFAVVFSALVHDVVSATNMLCSRHPRIHLSHLIFFCFLAS